jgi:hypothetical protein
MAAGTRGIALLLAIGVLLPTVGCGGGDQPTVSKAEFMKQAAAICAQFQKESEQAFREAVGKHAFVTRAEKEEWFLDSGLPPVDRMVERLGELDRPQGQKTEVEAILAKFEEEIQQSEAHPYHALIGNPFEDADRLVKSSGLGDCAV